ncbi:IS982 family transposase [Candidatus Electronema sp. PJ]|uniref:IS982 family transposase n=1 Tax=Candidatus Electronema sp. PJ TaxID=3401572 RepID=UPI003AA971FB
MDIEITAFYCVCDDLLKSLNYQDHSQCRMSAAEVMTAALTAAAFFGGDHEESCNFLNEYRYIPRMISKSRFSRRLAGIPEFVWRGLADWLASAAHGVDSLKIYIADSFPVPVCQNIRIKRCKIYNEECFRGYIASQRKYFYGLKVHVLMNESGVPAEIVLSHGSCSDISSAFHGFSLQIPSGSVIVADKAYNDYPLEDSLMERGIHLMPLRKKNSKRKRDRFVENGIKFIRKRIESAFSVIKQRFPAHIHAVTHQGFELKVFLFVLAYGIEKAMF